jgi:hypothetical protein
MRDKYPKVPVSKLAVLGLVLALLPFPAGVWLIFDLCFEVPNLGQATLTGFVLSTSFAFGIIALMLALISMVRIRRSHWLIRGESIVTLTLIVATFDMAALLVPLLIVWVANPSS